MKRFLSNKKNTSVLLVVFLIVILAQALIITKLFMGKDDKNYEVNLVKIKTEKDSINYLQMKQDLGKIDGVVRDLNQFLISKNISDNKIEKLDEDSLTNSIYVAKASNRYSQYLFDLQEKLKQVPLGMPSDGYISSNFGKRKNPIPFKTKPVTLASVSSPIPAAETVVEETKPELVQVKDSTGKVIAEVMVNRKIKTTVKNASVATTTTPNSSTKKTIREENKTPAEPDQIQFHKGMDIAVAYGSDVRAAASGKVIFAGTKGGYGNCVIISHGNGLATLYGHLSDLLVKTNEEVAVNQVIAKSGNSGRSTGPHLHYEVHKNNTPVNPKLFMTL